MKQSRLFALALSMLAMIASASPAHAGRDGNEGPNALPPPQLIAAIRTAVTFGPNARAITLRVSSWGRVARLTERRNPQTGEIESTVESLGSLSASQLTRLKQAVEDVAQGPLQELNPDAPLCAGGPTKSYMVYPSEQEVKVAQILGCQESVLANSTGEKAYALLKKIEARYGF